VNFVSSGPPHRTYCVHHRALNSTLTEPAVTIDQVILRTVAPEFGFDANQVAAYNNGFRNPVFSFLTAERLLIIYGNSGLDGVRAEIRNLRERGII